MIPDLVQPHRFMFWIASERSVLLSLFFIQKLSLATFQEREILTFLIVFKVKCLTKGIVFQTIFDYFPLH